MVYKMLSLTTSDIEGATPTKPFSRFTNKPPKDDIEGSRPKSQLKSWDRPVLNLTADDITGCHPVAVPIREHTRRSVNPLNPTYQLPSFTIQSTVRESVCAVVLVRVIFCLTRSAPPSS